MSLLEILTLISLSCPLLIFLDFHRRNTIHIAIIYILVFFLIYGFALPFLVDTYGFYFAGAIPLLLFLGLLVRKWKTK